MKHYSDPFLSQEENDAFYKEIEENMEKVNAMKRKRLIQHLKDVEYQETLDNMTRQSHINTPNKKIDPFFLLRKYMYYKNKAQNIKEILQNTLPDIDITLIDHFLKP